MYVNPLNVIQLLSIVFNAMELPESPFTESERQLSEELEIIIKDAMSQPMGTEIEWSLDFEFPNAVRELEIIEDNDETEDWNHQRYMNPNIDRPGEVCTNDNEDLDYDYKKQAVEFWRSGISGNRKISSVQSKFRKVQSVRQLRRWAHQVNQGGTYREKLKMICEYTLNNVMDAINRKVPFHDMDIRRWAIRARQLFDMAPAKFKASATWLLEFKKRHGIVSRKITKWVTKKTLATQESLEEQAAIFIQKVKTHIADFGVENVYNSDQSGFNLELHAGRTLALRGTKTVESTIQSKSATTHSYTIQPLISADGKLLSPLSIVLKESSGGFGPRVQETMFKPQNVYLMASKSGKLTSEHFQRWFQDVYLPHTGPKSVILLDSWSGQCPGVLGTMDFNGQDVKLLTIPPGTTGMIQPLDVYGFRVWKNYIKHFSDIVILYEYDVNLHLRDNIVKLQSLTHNQFSSPRFTDLFKYSWYKSGYIDARPPKFENPVEYCFAESSTTCDICGDVAIIKCAWCKKSLCLKHFFHEYHYCNDYHP